jgi:hypothetical protein
MNVDSLSTIYIHIPVNATILGAAYNPTGDIVDIACPVSGVEPVSDDWQAATWETIGTTYNAKLLIGPGGFTLAPGSYDTYVKVTDNPEIPVLLAGFLSIT